MTGKSVLTTMTETMTKIETMTKAIMANTTGATMTDDLVKRLRDEALSLHGSAWRDQSGGQETTMSAVLADQAADRIEALTAERDSLLSGHRILNIDGARLQDRAEKAEADNARLREVLERCPPDRPQMTGEEFRAAVNAWWAIWARPALAAKHGGHDDD